VDFNTKISVIIPTLNEEKYIAKCIHHLNKQSVSPYEIIIVDDDSGDRTKIIAKLLGCKVIHRRKSEIDFSKNIIATARNLGAKMAKGEYLFFVDADTILTDKNWLKKALLLMDKHRIDAIVGKFGCHDCRTILDKVLVSFWFHLSVIVKMLSGQHLYSMPSCLLIKKSVFNKTGGFPVFERNEDAALTRLIGRYYKIKLCLQCKSKTSVRRIRKMGYTNFLLYWLRYYLKRYGLRRIHLPRYEPIR